MTDSRKLTLVRHAKSSWGDSALRDIERPLNKRGLRDAPRMAAWLASRIDRPDLVLSSPARRAHATADVMAQAFGIAPADIRIEEWIYYRGASDWLTGLQSLSDDIQSVLLVGHNPTISDLASHLVGSGSMFFPTCAVCTLTLPAESWALVGDAPAELIHFGSPKAIDD